MKYADQSMNNTGYIYILGNKCLIPGLYKIGFSKQSPDKRAHMLSKSTSIADSFYVVYSKKIKNITIAERMIHLLLRDSRYSLNKEFYLAEIEKAKTIIGRVAKYIETENHISDSIGMTEELINSNYTIKQNANDMKILMLMSAASSQNTVFDTFLNSKVDIIQGFLNSEQTEYCMKISKDRACTIMNQFVKKHSITELKLNDHNPNIKVFREIMYENGLLAWIFSDHYRKHFNVNKSVDRDDSGVGLLL